MGRKRGITGFIYACVLCISFSMTTASLAGMLGLDSAGFLLLTGALAAGALLFFCLPLRAGASLYWKKQGRTAVRSAKSDGWAASAALTAVLLLVRIFSMPAGAAAQSLSIWTDRSGFTVSAGTVYTGLLAVLFPQDSGFTAVFTFNLLLQTAGMLLVFSGVKRLNGLLPAVGACLAVIFLPAFSNSAYTAEPQNLLLLFYGFLLWTGAVLFCTLTKNSVRRARLLRTTAAVGLLYGFVGAFSLPLFGIFLLLVCALFCIRQKRWAFFCMIELCTGAVCGFLFGILFFFLQYKNGGVLPSDLAVLMGQWFMDAGGRSFDVLLRSPTLTDYWLTFPLLIPAFGVLAGSRIPEKIPPDIWLAPLLASIALDSVTGAPMQERGITCMIFGIFAGAGVKYLVRQDSTGNVPLRKKAPTAAGGSAERVAGHGVNNNDFTSGVAKMMDSQKENSKPKPGEYLDNPLPVPKRHVKKEMEYGFEPDSDLMFFDIPVADSDDYDLDV